MTPIIGASYTVLVTDYQDFHIINRGNTLEEPSNHLNGLKIVRVKQFSE